jgi:hypothetical protein
MFTPRQRAQILTWGTAFLLGLSVVPLLAHGIFFIVLFKVYIPIAIAYFALYYSYKIIQTTNTTGLSITDVILSICKKKR